MRALRSNTVIFIYLSIFIYLYTFVFDAARLFPNLNRSGTHVVARYFEILRKLSEKIVERKKTSDEKKLGSSNSPKSEEKNSSGEKFALTPGRIQRRGRARDL